MFHLRHTLTLLGLLVPMTSLAYIINGEPLTKAEQEQVKPFMVSVEAKHHISPTEQRWMQCSGTLVGPRHVLTAAHCVYDQYAASEQRVRPQKVLLPAGGDLWPDYLEVCHSLKFGESPCRTVSRIVEPPRPYNFQHLHENDLVLLILGLGFEDSTPVTLVSETEALTDLPLMSLGRRFARLQKGILSPTRNLLKPSQLLMSGTSSGQMSCWGDSGSPVLVMDEQNGSVRQAGVISALSLNNQNGTVHPLLSESYEHLWQEDRRELYERLRKEYLQCLQEGCPPHDYGWTFEDVYREFAYFNGIMNVAEQEPVESVTKADRVQCNPASMESVATDLRTSTYQHWIDQHVQPYSPHFDLPPVYRVCVRDVTDYSRMDNHPITVLRVKPAFGSHDGEEVVLDGARVKCVTANDFPDLPGRDFLVSVTSRDQDNRYETVPTDECRDEIVSQDGTLRIAIQQDHEPEAKTQGCGYTLLSAHEKVNRDNTLLLRYRIRGPMPEPEHDWATPHKDIQHKVYWKYRLLTISDKETVKTMFKYPTAFPFTLMGYSGWY